MAIDQNRNEVVAAFEKISGDYLNDLHVKLEEMEDEALMDTFTIGELEEILCGLQGKASVFFQRAEELGVDNFKEMMHQAEQELENAKEESEILTSEVLNESKAMLLDVETQAQKLEALRIQFRNNHELEDRYNQHSDRRNELNEEILNTDKDISAMEASGEELMAEMQSFLEHDLALDYFHQEREQLHDDVADISFKLHHRRSEIPLPQ